MNVAEALALVAETEFSPFTKADYYSFQGIESQNPLIGYSGDWVIVIDGEVVLFENNGEWFIFNLNFTAEY